MKRTCALAALLISPLWLSCSAVAADLPAGVVTQRPADGPSVEVDGVFLVPYTQTIPGAGVTFRMTPVPAGETVIGSPDSERDRSSDEGPQRPVAIDAMWVAECEVSWAEYRQFMAIYPELKRLKQLRFRLTAPEGEEQPLKERVAKSGVLTAYLAQPQDVDAVTCPTPLYDASFTYSCGESPDQPAVTMSQYAAKQYTKWLSGITGLDYRLPTEAEWEHFARAGTTTAYSFGDDPSGLDAHAWHDGNADDETHAVGTKAPNPWGLHDVHGNAAEWVLDEYNAEHYATLAESATPAVGAALWPKRLFPRVIRGGSWQDEPAALRSAARFPSHDEDWSLSDPNQPTSPWWFTEYEAQAVGMRVVRPYAPMNDAWRERAWEADIDGIRFDVEDRLSGGRGAMGPATAELPGAIEAARRIDQ